MNTNNQIFNIMKKLIPSLLISILAFSSCQKIIDIEQEDAEQRVVIEANLFEGTNDFSVKLTRTGNFFGDNSVELISNASVTISDGTTSFPMPYTGNGTYILPSFSAISGTEYTLIVSENGNNYEAKATMPNVVPIDSISYEFLPQSTFNDSGYLNTIRFRDPANEVNFYRIFISFGQEFFGSVESLIILDDGFVNGNSIEFPLFAAGVAQQNDTVRMELHSCDQSTFTYLEGVDALITGGNGAPPANPDGNFTNRALGNFSVYAVAKKSVVIIP